MNVNCLLDTADELQSRALSAELLCWRTCHLAVAYLTFPVTNKFPRLAYYVQCNWFKYSSPKPPQPKRHCGVVVDNIPLEGNMDASQ